MREKLSTAVSNPGRAAKFAWNVLSKVSHRYLWNRGATIYREGGFDPVPTTFDDAIRTDLFDELDVDPADHADFRTYLVLRNFAHYYQCESVLEIGAGLSTAIWAEYSSATGAEVTSIDANFDIFDRWIANTSFEQTIADNVTLREGMSIGADDLREFYGRSHAEYAGRPIEAFRDEMDLFARASGCPVSRIKAASGFADRRDWRVSDIVVSDRELSVPEGLLYFYVKGNERFSGLLKTMAQSESTGLLDGVTGGTSGWDLVWLDSGEVSSLVEWSKIRSSVEPGGLVALHDVFFPKSMKNFVVAAALTSDPEWEVLFVDPSTKQGLLVARRRP